MKTLTRFKKWAVRKIFGVKYGIDIELVGTVAFIRVDCGYMPPSKAQEHTLRYAKIFTEEVRIAMGVTHCQFVPYTRG